MPASAAGAGPVLVPESQVGAVLPVQAVAAPQVPVMPPAPRVSGGACAFQFATPPPVPVKHVAPCGGAGGTGAATKPWGMLKQALVNLKAGDVAYVHDDPSRSVDYAEADLTPTAGGTGEPCTGNAAAPARIRLMGAPGEATPVVEKPASAPVAKPVLRLSRNWWLVEGIRFNGSRVERHSVVVVEAGCVVLRRVEVTGAGTANAAVAFSDATQGALLNSHIWEPLTGNAVTGRPAADPKTTQDHHGVTVSKASNRLLVRDNHSYGHNGDSIQCGEIDDNAKEEDPDPNNLTIAGNRYHQDEENAIDLKRCVRVTVSANKLYGYYPARPHRVGGMPANRAPQGDAIVVHHNRLEAAERVLIERNRLFHNSRSVNLGSQASRAVVRRNVIFSARTDLCGIGAGIAAAAQRVEIYHNTLDLLPAPMTTPGSQCPNAWSASERAAIRLTNQSSSPRPVLWNNIVARASRHLAMTLSATVLDARRNLFDVMPAVGAPADSRIGDPKFVADPAINDYFTRPGSPARDAAAPVPTSVLDPVAYCDDPGDTDTLAEPDIGFLETCPSSPTAGNNVLTGNSRNNVICGLAGSDVIRGRAGDDTLFGDRCGARAKVVPRSGASAAGGDDDKLHGGRGNDRLYGSGGADRLRGGPGADRLRGGTGRDKLKGGAGRDRLHGGRGRDRLSARGGGRDRVICGRGRDTVRADARDRLRGCERIRP